MFRPKIFDTFKEYSLKQFRNDITAGVIVGVVALPLAIAFAIASGVSPDKGLVTSIIAGFLISALGGSRVQIGGPTGAFVVIVYDIVQKHGIEGLTIATILGGLILCIFGLARLGTAIKFIPYPVVIGFTSGIAVIIFSSQMKDFFGLNIEHVPSEFLSKWSVYFQSWKTLNPFALGIALFTILNIVVLRRISKDIPGTFVAIVLTSLAVYAFHIPVETIGSRFPAIPNHFPAPQWPTITWDALNTLIRPALTIAVLAGIESLLSAVVADGMIGGRHRSNTELVAQGIANMVTPLFGGIPATGAIARTATNIHSGGRTPVAGIIHAAVLFFIMTLLGDAALKIPLATLSGILVVVAYRMAEWHSFFMVLNAPRSDAVVLITTFLLTIFFDLTVAIEIGVILAVLLFVRRLSQNEVVKEIKGAYRDEEDRDDPQALSRKEIPSGIEIYEINGPFFFGMVSTFIETMNNVEKNPKVRILRMRHVPSIDATAINALRQVILQSRKHGISIVLSGVNRHVSGQLMRSGVVDLVGPDHIASNIDHALDRAQKILTC